MSEQLRLWAEAPTQHNVFFAARPDSKAVESAVRVRQSLLLQHRRFAAKSIPSERLHVSLLGGFVDPLPPAIMSAAMTAAGTVSMPPFKVMFNRISSFNGGSGQLALVLTGDEGIVGFRKLQEALSLALARAGLSRRRKTLPTPHMTIAYSDRSCELSIEPICWTVNEFVLIDSLVGQSRHLLLGRWPCVG